MHVAIIVVYVHIYQLEDNYIQECHKSAILQETVDCLQIDKVHMCLSFTLCCLQAKKSLLQNVMEEQLRSLSLELQTKKLPYDDQKLLYAKMTDVKVENVSAIAAVCYSQDWEIF